MQIYAAKGWLSNSESPKGWLSVSNPKGENLGPLAYGANLLRLSLAHGTVTFAFMPIIVPVA